jgi:uncharacterized Zn finger protein (UPF0148 family)
MTIVAIECKHCGGTLPSPGSGSPFVTCPYCGTCHAVTASPIALAPGVGGPSEYEVRQAAAKKAWETAKGTSTDPVVALRAVVADVAHDMKTEQELERAARLTEALARGFDQRNGTESVSNPDAILRIAEAAVKAVIQLRLAEDTDVNLPFLMTDHGGVPVHLEHHVTRSTLADLDAMGVFVVKEAPPPPRVAAHEGTATPKAKRWWPFG